MNELRFQCHFSVINLIRNCNLACLEMNEPKWTVDITFVIGCDWRFCSIVLVYNAYSSLFPRTILTFMVLSPQLSPVFNLTLFRDVVSLTSHL